MDDTQRIEKLIRRIASMGASMDLERKDHYASEYYLTGVANANVADLGRLKVEVEELRLTVSAVRELCTHDYNAVYDLRSDILDAVGGDDA